ncbi:MAG: thermonuclease family protein [Chloroflexota bacterium]
MERIELKRQSKLYHYVAFVKDVYDGDTATVDLDLGLNTWRQNEKLRFWGLNTPEVRGAEKEAGRIVRDYVRELILGKYVIIRTILDKRGDDSTGKYGRLLAEIFLTDENGEEYSLNQHLLDMGMAQGVDSGGSIIKSSQTSSTRGVIPAADVQHVYRPDLPQEEEPMVSGVACPCCGESRAVDTQTDIIEECPNCLDEAYDYAVYAQEPNREGFMEAFREKFMPNKTPINSPVDLPFQRLIQPLPNYNAYGSDPINGYSFQDAASPTDRLRVVRPMH